MITRRRAVALISLIAVLLNCSPRATACGPNNIEPIFVFEDSPDPPFEEFTRGKLGILQPTLGRKTLSIAFRYVNGGSFTSEEQRALIEALRGTAPEDEGEDAVRIWIKARKEAGIEEEKLPAIYAERQYGGYDFFPNCTRSAFETSTETLRDRMATNGADDQHVRSWLAAQDTVFQNCAGGSSIPQELGLDKPEWLRKDREYQIAAAFFYSLNFDEARERFERIAADNDSPWRQTADYLVARTLVRQASLESDETAKRTIYERAERHLQLLLGTGGKFLNASQKLVALIDYRLRPEERVGELGRILAFRNGNENLRQDLIDYVWLLDKFDAQVIMREEEKRKMAVKGDKDREDPFHNAARMATREAVNRGDLIEITFVPKKGDGEPDYWKGFTVEVKHDISEAEILQLFVQKLERKLTSDEISEIRVFHQDALQRRRWLLAPNQKLGSIVRSQYEGYYYYDGEKPTLDLLPAFLRTDELSDWILTFQSTDPKAYTHAVSKWRETDSTSWLLAALAKAERTSPDVDKLLSQAEKVRRDSAAYPTTAYHLVRLNIAFGKQAEARKLLDDILSWQSDLLPVSAQNQFRKLGMQLAANSSEFVRFSQRKPVAFYNYGAYGKISDLLKIEKGFWDPKDSSQTKEEFEQEVEERFKDLLPLDDRFAFDEKAFDVFNTHFPLEGLAEAGRDRALPDYLQQRVLLVVWTRAILLKNEKVARKTAADIIVLAPQMELTFMPYINARTLEEREHAALYVLLRTSYLSPFVDGGVSVFDSAEESNYYFGTSWWCTPSETEYDIKGNESPKVVAKPHFLSPGQLETARRERTMLIAIGNGKSYLGKLAIAWARKSPDDVRVPEALFIAVKANESYKYGCGGWEADEKIQQEAETLLLDRYPDSPWTAKLSQELR